MKITWFNLLEQITAIKASVPTPAVTVSAIITSDLPAVAATFADLAAARTSVSAQNVAVELRLDALDAKINDILTKLKSARVILNA